jgi:hypothetical protein
MASRTPFPLEFRVSLPEILLLDMTKIPLAPLYEGYGQWVYTTYAALPRDLRTEMEVVLAFIIISGTFYKWLIELPEEDSIHHDYLVFVDRLRSLSEEDVRYFLRTGLEVKLSSKLEKNTEELSLPSMDDPEAVLALLQELDLYTDTLKAHLQESGRYEEFMDRNVELICNPPRLKERLVSGVVHFWEDFYREEYESSFPVMERSVEYHRSQNYTGDFPAIFEAITGRHFPEGLYRYLPASRAVFFPSCYSGPQVGVYIIEEQPPVVLFNYNCRPTGILKHDSDPSA